MILNQLILIILHLQKQKTQIQNVLESRFVAGTGLEPVTFGL